jgi:hypothetical protein
MEKQNVIAVRELQVGIRFIINNIIYKVDRIEDGRIYYKRVVSRDLATNSLGANSSQKVLLA